MASCFQPLSCGIGLNSPKMGAEGAEQRFELRTK